jgi:hypothetical protein
VVNIKAILLQLSVLKSTHSEGKMYASLIMNVNFENAFCTAKNIQQKGMLSYGPFIRKGTNYSRFAAKVIKSASPSFIKKLRFKYPSCISPSPKRNVCTANHHYYIVDNNNCFEVKKNKLQAYFSSIEQ